MAKTKADLEKELEHLRAENVELKESLAKLRSKLLLARQVMITVKSYFEDDTQF